MRRAPPERPPPFPPRAAASPGASIPTAHARIDDTHYPLQMVKKTAIVGAITVFISASAGCGFQMAGIPGTLADNRDQFTPRLDDVGDRRDRVNRTRCHHQRVKRTTVPHGGGGN